MEFGWDDEHCRYRAELLSFLDGQVQFNDPFNAVLTENDWNTDENLEIIFYYVSDANSDLFNHMVENKDLYIEKFGQIEVSSKFQTLMSV